MNEFDLSPEDLKHLRAEAERRLKADTESRSSRASGSEPAGKPPAPPPVLLAPFSLPTVPSFEPRRWYLLRGTGPKQGPFTTNELFAQLPLPTDRVRKQSRSDWVRWEAAGQHYPELREKLRQLLAALAAEKPPSPVTPVAPTTPPSSSRSWVTGLLERLAVVGFFVGLFVVWLIWGGNSRASRESQQRHLQTREMQRAIHADFQRQRERQKELDAGAR